jgi:hypothetical protein
VALPDVIPATSDGGDGSVAVPRTTLTALIKHLAALESTLWELKTNDTDVCCCCVAFVW